MIRENDTVIDANSRLLRPASLLKICSSLISYNSYTTRVRLAHSSVRAYLVSPKLQSSSVQGFFLDETTALTKSAMLCIRYLMQPAFRSGYCTTDAQLTKRMEDWPMLDYVTENSFYHLSHAVLDDSLRSLMLAFFNTHSQPQGGNFGAWVQSFSPTIDHSNIESSTPLYYAARFDVLPVVKLIIQLEGTKDLETPGGVYGCTPLHVAAYMGNTTMVRELLRLGANARESNELGETGLQWANAGGFTKIAEMLRNAGAHVDGLPAYVDDDASDADPAEAMEISPSSPGPHKTESNV